MSHKGTQQAHRKESALDGNKGIMENIYEQEKCISEQKTLIDEQEGSIVSQKDSMKKLKDSIEDQEADLKKHGSTFDQSESIQHLRKGLDNQSIEMKKKSKEITSGEKIEIENTVTEMKRILDIQYGVMGVQRHTFEKQNENIDKEKIFLAEQERNIAQQTNTKKEQEENIAEQNEILKYQKKFLKDLKMIINDGWTTMKTGEKPSLNSNEGNQYIQELNHFDGLLKSIKESCPDNIKVGFTGIMAGILMITAALLVSWCDIIDKDDNVCDRKSALKNLGIDFSCRYQEVQNESEKFLITGVVSFITDFFNLVICLIFFSVSPEHRNTGLLFVNIFFAVEAVPFFISLFCGYSNFSGFTASPKPMDYGPLKQDMINSLTLNYKSDDISSSDIMSNNWNTFFITYDCCAVNQVFGTTNDFDTTPWCTTSGSCQQTNSQIPRTCCKDVTKDDYVNASTSCHATVGDGTYKEGCLSRIKSLSDVAVQECNINAMMTYVLTLAMIKVAAFSLNFVMAIMYFVCKKRDKKPNSIQTTPSTSSQAITSGPTIGSPAVTSGPPVTSGLPGRKKKSIRT